MAQRAFSDFIGIWRASAAWRFNSSGVLVQEAAGTPRDDYDQLSGLWNGLLIEEARVNTIRNNSMLGAAAGTPGTFPNNWSLTNQSGVSTQIVGSGVQNGIPYVDVRFYGTTTSSAGTSLLPEALTITPAATGQVWTASTFFALVGGSLANLATANLYLQSADSSTATVDSGFTSLLNISSTLTRVTRTLTLAGAGVAYARQFFNFTPTASGVAINFTLRIGAPQLEQGPCVTSPILTTNGQVTRAGDQVFVGSLTPWFNPAEGTAFLQLLVPQTQGVTRSLLEFGDGTLSNRFYLGASAGGGVVINSSVAGVTGASAGETLRGSVVGGVMNVAMAYSSAGLAISVNGNVPVAAALPVVPSVTRLAIGATSTLLNQPNTHIRALKYTPRRMSNAELQSLSTLPSITAPTLALSFKSNTFSLEHI